MGLVFLSTGLFPRAGGGSNTSDSIWNAFPLARGNRWVYEIRRKDKKVGRLEIRVLSERTEQRKKTDYISYYQLSYIDGYLKKSYKRRLAVTPDIFIENPRDGKFYPFVKAILRVGQRMHDMLVVNVAPRKLEGRVHLTATLKHLRKDREEVYMNDIGLYSIREGDITYKLIQATVRRP